ncbi:MAG TPA: hypothetical protein VM662_05510 [Sphingomonas sp.]|nr:hypothetical protein [Sphingomonas sp.]
MVQAYSNSASGAQNGAYRVERPRASDAIAGALREAFDHDLGLPNDMAALLHRLNGHRRATP